MIKYDSGLWVFLFMLLLCVVLAVSVRTVGRSEAVDTGSDLRVMTINVWSGLDYKGNLKMGEYESPETRELRFQALLAEIGSLKPDVIGVNEANFLPDYVERLAAKLGFDYIYHVGVSGARLGRVGLPWNLREGDAILARKGLGLTLVGREQLSGGPVGNFASFHTTDATQVLVGRIRFKGKDIYIADTHWHAWPPDTKENRELLKKLKEKMNYSGEQYKEALESLEKDNAWRMDESRRMAAYLKKVVPKDAFLLVLGDFNSEADWPEMQSFRKNGYYDTFAAVSKEKGYTWDPVANENQKKHYPVDLEKKQASLYDHLGSFNEKTARRIDFILARDNLSKGAVRESRVCAKDLYKGVHPSDHYGVFTVIKVP